jgi:uncharacterized protein (UPF0335 family)
MATVSNILDGLNEWEDFIDFIDKLEENRSAIGNDIKTVVFDTVNKAYDLCEPYTLKQLGRLDGKRYSKPSDVAHGQFYPARDKYFAEQIDRLLKLGFMPLFISHSQVKTINPKEGDSYDIYTSTMSDRLEKIIYPLVSYIIFGEETVIDDGNGGKIKKRVLRVKSNEVVDTGSRVVIKDDIIFDTEQEAIDKFQEQFKNSIQEKLIKAGITTDIDTLAKQQEKEKMDKVNNYVSTNQESNSILVEKITKLVPTLSKELQGAVMKKISEYGITSFENPDALNRDHLLDIYKMIK